MFDGGFLFWILLSIGALIVVFAAMEMFLAIVDKEAARKPVDPRPGLKGKGRLRRVP